MEEEKKLLPVLLPEFNKPVRAVIKHWQNWTFHTDVVLVSVDESDCNWRLYDENSELSYDWNVIYWEYLKEE